MGPTGDRAILQIHPSRRCNLRCQHCYSRSGPEVNEALEFGVLARALSDASQLGYDVVGVSGGEPLLYRSLNALLREARRLGMRTTITTNGMAITERRLEQLADLVDILAISLDGTPATHVELRGDKRAFTAMERNLAAVRASGIAFGFICTLTQHNVHELAWVASFAERHGAALLQVHPLEPEGYAADALGDSVPDPVELAYAFVESLRLGACSQLAVQLDVVRRSDLKRSPDRFFACDDDVQERLGEWLTPLVIETSGRVVPLTYGFDDRFALGSLTDAPLAVLAEEWSPGPFRALCRQVHADLMLDGAPEVINWYDEVTRASRRAIERRH